AGEAGERAAEHEQDRGRELVGVREHHSDQTSRRPSIALCMVTSSAYSRSLPTGTPMAIRVTLIPSGFSSRARYKAVASPSTLGLVARIISSMPPSAARASRLLIFSSSGPIPCSGDSAPISTWYTPLKSRVFSMAVTFCGSSTTQISLWLRLSDAQYMQGSTSVVLLQIEQ